MRDTTPTGRRTRRRGLRVVATAAAALLVASCLAACSEGSASSEGSGSGKARDTIVVVTPDQASNVVRDYAFTAGSDNQEVTNSIHAQLIRKPYIEEEGANVKVQDLYSFEPFLAESYEVSDDQLTYTFHLKEGVLSQQGNELTADDVLWSFERKFATPGGGMAGYYAPMLTDLASQLKKVDDYTVTFQVEKPGYGFTLLGNLAENIGSVYDSDYLKEHATAADPYAVEWGVEDMLNGNFGYGPYMLESVTPGQEIVMVANPNYVGGKLSIQKMIRRVVPDAATRANMLKNGDADVALDLRPSDQQAMESDPNIFTPTARTNLYHAVTLNHNAAPFDDKLVRQAFAYAIPYEDIVKDVYFDRAILYKHLLDDKMPYYDGSALPDYSYDPERAKELLAQAGIETPVSFKLTVSNANPAIVDSAVLIAARAKDAGFDVTIDQQPAAQVFSDGLAGKLQASTAQGSAVTMSPPYQLNLLTQPGGGSNQSFWSGPDFEAFQKVMDEAMEAGDAVGPEAGPLWSKAEAMLHEDAGNLLMVRVLSPYSMRADVEGYAQRTDRRIDYSVVTAGE